MCAKTSRVAKINIVSVFFVQEGVKILPWVKELKPVFIHNKLEKLNPISIDGERHGENKPRVLEYGTDFLYPIGLL